MKYTTTVTINKNLDTVYKALDDREAAFKWIDGLEKFDLLEGELGKVNSKYLMEFRNAKGKLSSMTETITEKTTSRITTIYETKGVWNECINRLSESNETTVYEMDTDFKFGFPIKLFIWMFKPMFKSETLRSLTKFKDYCESLE